MDKRRIMVGVLIIILSIGAMFLIGKVVHNPRVLGEKTESFCHLLKRIQQPFCITDTIHLGDGSYLASAYNPIQSLSAIAIIDRNNHFIQWLGKTEPHIRDEYFPVPGEYVSSFGFEEIDGASETKEFVVQFTNTGTSEVHPWYLYSYQDKRFTLLLQLIDSDNKITITDFDDDGVKEILHNYSIYGIGALEKDTLRWTDIWTMNDGKALMVNASFPDEYQTLLDKYDEAMQELPNDFITKYKEIMDCLRDKAVSVMQGKEVSGDECSNIAVG